MSAVAFDTHKFIRRLKESGMPEPQAEAIAEALADALRQNACPLEQQADVVEARLMRRFTLLQGMLGCQLGLTLLMFILVLARH